jgi:hypothetical protein
MMTAEEKIKRIGVLIDEMCELGAELLTSCNNPLEDYELISRVELFINDFRIALVHRAITKMRKKWPEYVEKRRQELKEQNAINILPGDPDYRLN